MLGDLLPLIAALTAAGLIYVFREVRRARMTISPRAPGITIAQTWDLWIGGVPNHPDRQFLPPDLGPQRVTEALRETARQVLLETEAAWGEEPGRAGVRQAILDSALRALHLAAIGELGETEREALIEGYETGMDQQLRDQLRTSTIRWVVLRLHARMKYDDAVKGDWFHRFLHLAGPYVREKARLARESVLHMDEGAGSFAKIYDAMLEELQAESLEIRPKRRFVDPGLPGPPLFGQP